MEKKKLELKFYSTVSNGEDIDHIFYKKSFTKSDTVDTITNWITTAIKECEGNKSNRIGLCLVEKDGRRNVV